MKRFLIAAAALLTLAQPLLTSPAFAQDGSAWYERDFSTRLYGPYVSGAVGGNWPTNGHAQILGIDNKVRYERPALAGALAAGWSWGDGLRTELEYSYRSNEVNKVTGASSAGGAGEITTNAVLANLIWDFDDLGWVIVPYAGGGIGYSWVNVDNIRTINGTSFNKDQGRFAYQWIFGVQYPFNPNVRAFTDYRYFHTEEVDEITTTLGSNFRGRLNNRHHTFMAGLRYQWGDVVPMAAPAPEPVAAPIMPAQPLAAAPPPMPAPAPARVMPAVPNVYMVFFDFDRSVLTPEAKRILQQVAQDMRIGRGAQIHVVGHTDRAGSPQYNMRLSQRRASVVRDELVRLGVPSNDVSTQSVGESQPRVPTADGIREAQNRRAEIIFR